MPTRRHELRGRTQRERMLCVLFSVGEMRQVKPEVARRGRVGQVALIVVAVNTPYQNVSRFGASHLFCVNASQ